MLTDKTHSAADFDQDASNAVFNRIRENSPLAAPLHPIMNEPKHKTRRKARRASARLAYEKAKLEYAAKLTAWEIAPEKNPRPMKPKNWRNRKPPAPTVDLWFTGLRQRGGNTTMKRRHNLVSIPTKQVTILRQRDNLALVRLPISLAAKYV